MSKRGSSLVEDNYVPMIGCFVAGFVVNRLMNHQDVVTGDVEEGMETQTHKDGAIMFLVISIVVWGGILLDCDDCGFGEKVIILLAMAFCVLGSLVYWNWADSRGKTGVEGLGVAICVFLLLCFIGYKSMPKKDKKDKKSNNNSGDKNNGSE